MDEGTLSARADDLAKPGSRRYHENDVRVASPVARTSSTHPGDVAQLGERLVCNQEATGSIPVSSTRFRFIRVCRYEADCPKLGVSSDNRTIL